LAFNTRASGSSSIAETMRLSSAGNLGVGTANPAARLHIGGNNPELRFDYGSGYDTYYGSLRWSGLQLGNNGDNRIVAGRTSSGGSLSFWVNNTNEGADYSQTPNGTLAMVVAASGNVGIGTGSPGYKLEVAGSIRATSFISNTTSYADFVFKPGYQLRSLADVEAAIKRDGHLPDIPSEAEARAHGIDLAAQQVKLLQKLEEVTLHLIEHEKALARLGAENDELRARLNSPR
jgi:hypothetical protein